MENRGADTRVWRGVENRLDAMRYCSEVGNFSDTFRGHETNLDAAA